MAKTPNIILTCADYRCEQANQQIVKQLETADRLVALGSSLGIVNGDRQAELLKEIEGLCSLHGCTTLVIVDHMNCGRYRLEYGEMDSAQERGHHEHNQKKAVEVVKQAFPTLEVKTLILDHDESSDQMVVPAALPQLISA